MRRVEGESKTPFEERKKNELPEELKEYRKGAQALVDSHRRFFITFAKDVSLQFKLSNAFYTDLETGEVNLATQWFAEKGFSKDQILWAFLHELSHFRDFSQDPEGMNKNFDYMTNQAKKTGTMMMKKWEEAYGKDDPEFINQLKKQRPASKKDPSKTMNSVEGAAYKFYHTFYNIFDDIYVNNLVSRKAPKYEEAEKGGEEVRGLYKEKLFAESDYSKSPRHLQFLYKLLREEMVSEPVLVNGEVVAAMEQKIMFQGKEYAPKEIVEYFIKPRAGRDTKPGQRYFVLQKTLEPIFEQLLLKDLEDWQPKKPEPLTGKPSEGESSLGEINPFEDDYQKFDDKSPDQIKDEDFKNWVNKYQEDKKKEEEQGAKEKQEEAKSAEEKAKEAQENLDRDWSAKHNINYETLRRFRKIEAEVAPYLDDLSKLWQRIIFGSIPKIERGMEGYFKTGAEMDIQKVIEEWPQIEKGQPEKAEVMKRVVSKEVLIRKPELIRVRLVGDMSGSMDEAKKHVLQQSFVLLLSSLREFNTYLNLTRPQTKAKLEVDTEAWIFGDDAQKVKRLRGESGMDDEQAEIVRIFEKLQNTLGSTYDNRALGAINNSLSPEDREKIAQEKIMEIVFEITDGGSSSPRDARAAVDTLVNSGVIARAFQIGAVSAEEKRIFNEVWNRGREDKLGEIVGEKIGNLLPIVAELLKQYLKNVKL